MPTAIDTTVCEEIYYRYTFEFTQDSELMSPSKLEVVLQDVYTDFQVNISYSFDSFFQRIKGRKHNVSTLMSLHKQLKEMIPRGSDREFALTYLLMFMLKIEEELDKYDIKYVKFGRKYLR